MKQERRGHKRARAEATMTCGAFYRQRSMLPGIMAAKRRSSEVEVKK
jgi:hypothetical protein